MLGLNISKQAKKAIYIGTMCAISYLSVYVARNILSAVSPQMIEKGIFSTESIGTFSSVYFIIYALGQLINGMIGDKIKTKNMISFGLFFAGIFILIFSAVYKSLMVSYVVYGITGYFLSMIYGPMTKVVAENTEPLYATRCSVGYEFACLLGSPVAGLLAAFLLWKSAIIAGGIILMIMGVVCFAVFSSFEKKGMIQYNKYDKPKESGGIKILIEHGIIKFTLISVITGVVRTAVVFWLPTYISQFLGFSSEKSALIFTVATVIISSTTFISVFIYERLGGNMELTILLSFISAAICFLAVFLFKSPFLNIGFMILAIMSSNSAATMLWSRYCPSLRDTGMVSSATGYLDFISYMGASLSSIIFANAVADIGWGNLILVWFGLMVAGVMVSLPFNKILNKKQEQL